MLRLDRFARGLGLAGLLCAVLASSGCNLNRSSHQLDSDPLHLGVTPGPLGSTLPQTIVIRLGSEPSDRIVSLSLTISSLELTNSGGANLELLTAPVTVELTRSAIVTEPIFVGPIYQDTYSALIFPSMTGQVLFYDNTNHLTTQPLSVAGRTVELSPSVVLGTSPEVLSISLDLARTFTVGANSVTVNPIVVRVSSTAPVAPIPPAVSQPETGVVSFLVGTVTLVDTVSKTISMQPSSGDALNLSYDDATQFVNCAPTMLTGMMIEAEGATESHSLGNVLVTRVALIERSASSSELYGLLGGPAPNGIDYNLIVEGGAGVNVSTGLIGKNVTVDWLAANYAVNRAHVNMSGSDDLIFDEARTFPGQFVALQWDTLIVPDPDSINAGFMQPRMFELQEQTISGQVSAYVYDPISQSGTFTLNVDSVAPIKIMNSGLTSITVRRVPQTYLRDSQMFIDGDRVIVRGLLFVDPNYSNANYQPPDPVAFVMVADRISAPMSLGSASAFEILAASTITNTGPTVVSGGDLGLSPGTSVTGFPPGTVAPPAVMHVADSIAAQAQTDLTTAYNYVAGLSGASVLAPELSGLTLTPGVYKTSAASALSSGQVTLDAQGDVNAVFIFQVGSTLTTGDSTQVVLVGNAQAKNVFWQIGSSATLGTNSIFQGTIMASESITLLTGVNIKGRALALNAAVTLDSDSVTAP